MATFGKCHGGGRRAAHRSAAPLIAVLTTLSSSHSAVVVDISSTGARLRTSNLPECGRELMIGIEDVRAFGRVAWAEHDECGIEFDCPLSLEEEQLLRSRVATVRGLPAEMRTAFESWVAGSGR